MAFLNILIFGIIMAFGFYYLANYIKGNLCHLENRIDGKVVLITGSNTGIGLETAIELAKRGGIIHLACRNHQKCKDARNLVLTTASVDEDRVFFHIVDLASINSILSFTEQFRTSVKKLDILINNAGIMMTPYQETEDGFEMQIGVNHLGHFLLTNRLLDILKAAESARILIVSSSGHARGTINTTDINLRGDDYGKIVAYGQSKLANILHAKYLAKHLKQDGITVVSLHPGVVFTELLRYLPCSHCITEYGKYLIPYLIRTPFEGAQTSICCAVNPNLHEHSGKYFNDCQPFESSNPEVNNETLADLLWQQSTDLITSKLKNKADIL